MSHSEMGPDDVIGFIGGGNMAKAIAKGILKTGVVKPCQIIISAPSKETQMEWKELSVTTTNVNADVVARAGIIILAVKPHQLNTAVADIKSRFGHPPDSKLFVSVLAGVSCKALHSTLSHHVQENARVIRVMPNVLSTVCEGCSAICPDYTAKEKDVKVVSEIFSAIGKVEIVTENLLHAVTGLSGSGPAYIFAVIEALSDGGVKQGLPRNLATTFAAQTVLGAAKMVLETQKHPGQLKDEVCSAGGTTIHGIHALEKGKLRATLMNAIEAATQRSEQLEKLHE